jgi:hypothetical protein
VLLTLKEPGGGLTALLLFYLLVVSAYQILIVGLASALFPQLYYTLSPKEKKKYRSQKTLFFPSVAFTASLCPFVFGWIICRFSQKMS